MNTRFKDSSEASKEVYDGFNAWSSAPITYGMQMGYAIIAANWAIHAIGDNGVHAILENGYAKWSMIVVIAFLGINLSCSLLMSGLYRVRYMEMEKNPAKWEEEYKQYVAKSENNPFPFTKPIESLGALIRMLNLLGPLISGLLLIKSMF